MSKSRGNVVTPDAYVSELGADAVRAYLMFIGPWEQGGEWNDSGISGVSRWLNRVWNLVLGGYQPRAEASPQAERELLRTVHQTIRKVSQDMERIRLNTMVAALMEYTNYLAKVKEEDAVITSAWEQAVDTLLLLMAPTTPHLAEELWQKTGHDYSIHDRIWPRWDEELAKEEEITLVVQVNGKLRDRINVPASITENEAQKMAMDSAKVKAHLEGKNTVKVIYVPGKLVNIVTD
jgi:leucyl-tRNA synthetase